MTEADFIKKIEVSGFKRPADGWPISYYFKDDVGIMITSKAARIHGTEDWKPFEEILLELGVTRKPVQITVKYGCYGCPFVSRASEDFRYCAAKTVETHGGTWQLPPESCVDNMNNRRPDWCPLPAIVEVA